MDQAKVEHIPENNKEEITAENSVQKNFSNIYYHYFFQRDIWPINY